MGDQYWPICRQSFADLHMGLGDSMPWSPSSRWSLILKVNSEGAAFETVCPRLVAVLRQYGCECLLGRTRLRVLIEVPPLI